MDDVAAIDRLVEVVRTAGTLDRVTVERMAGKDLRQTLDTGYFKTFEATGVEVGPLKMSVEFRDPVKGSGATAGGLLVMHVIEGCLRKAKVEAHYAPWTLTNAPRGGSPDEEASWSRFESWGKLSFGFAESNPDCLSTIVFKARN